MLDDGVWGRDSLQWKPSGTPLLRRGRAGDTPPSRVMVNQVPARDGNCRTHALPFSCWQRWQQAATDSPWCPSTGTRRHGFRWAAPAAPHPCGPAPGWCWRSWQGVPAWGCSCWTLWHSGETAEGGTPEAHTWPQGHTSPTTWQLSGHDHAAPSLLPVPSPFFTSAPRLPCPATPGVPRSSRDMWMLVSKWPWCTCHVRKGRHWRKLFLWLFPMIWGPETSSEGSLPAPVPPSSQAVCPHLFPNCPPLHFLRVEHLQMGGMWGQN